jgi:MFS family permease
VLAAGHGFGLALFPLGAALVAGVFAAMLTQRFAARHHPHEGVWAVALWMYAVASFAMFLGVVHGWTAGDFRAYWLFGAVLNVPFLFAGEVYLLARNNRLWPGVFVLALVGLAVYAGVEVFRAPIHPAELRQSLPLGRKVFGKDGLPNLLAQLYSIPAYFLLLFGLVWSAWGMKGKPQLKDRTLGTFGIAIGATIVAIGSGIGAAFHIVPLFSVALAAGILVMFLGFLRASRPHAPRPQASPAPARS